MLIITYYCLSVKIETDIYNLQEHLKLFLKKFYTSTQASFAKVGEADVKLFASKVNNQGIYYLHTNQFIHLYHYLKEMGVELKADEKIDKRDYKVEMADFKVRSHWVLRDYQVPIVDFLLDNPTKSKLIPINTGQGKTTISLHAIASINQKLGIVILPVLCDKWISDIVDVHEATTKDVMVVQGSKALRSIISMAKSDTADSNYYIFSSRTMQEYINTYEENPELCLEMYGCAPIDLFPLLGIGVMLVDESHMQWHNIFKILIHSNVKYQIGLTATLLSDDPVVKRLYKIVYPETSIYGDKLIQKYTDVYAVAYSITPHLLKHIRTTNYGSNNYAHIAFEQSIMKKPDLYKSYIRLILTTIEDYFITDYKPGDKLLIYVATVKLATLLSDVLKEQYFKYVVNRYCEDDPYEFLMNSDIVVSSMIKSSTGVDIKGLRTVIQTISISSQVSNIQSLGRLRKLTDRDTKFVYLYSSNIPKQKDYHLRKMELFRDRAAIIVLRQSSVGL